MRHDDSTSPSFAGQQASLDARDSGFGYGVPVFEAQIETLKAVVERLGGEVAALRRERDMWRNKAEGAPVVRWLRRRAG
jgi:hypothetical protein